MKAMPVVLTMDATPAEIRAWRRTREARDLATAVIAAHPTCHLRIPGVCTGRSTTCDHIVPVATNPTMAADRANCLGACKPCNDTRQDMPLVELRRRIADGTLRTTPRQPRTPEQARQRMARRRTTSPAATAFFTTGPRP